MSKHVKSRVLGLLTSIQSSVKVLHWTAKAHAHHVALGDLYDDLDDPIDRLAEAILGTPGSSGGGGGPSVSSAAGVTFENMAKRTAQDSLQAMHGKLVEVRASFAGDEPLQSLVDELIVAFRRAMYLCDMK